MTELNAEANNGVVNGAATHEVNGEAEVLPFANLGADVTTAPAQDAAAINVPPATGRNGSAPESSAEAPLGTAKSSPANGSSANAREEPAPQPMNGSAPPAAQAADRSKDSGDREVQVADIKKGQLDARGEKIDFVFFRRRDFVIYRSGGKILVQYADQEATAKNQISNTAELLPLRGRLQYLVKDMAAPTAYHWQIAEALRLGLDGQKDAAKSTLQAAIDDINATRLRKGRTAYLVYAGAMVLGALAMLCGVAGTIWFGWQATPDQVAKGLKHLMMATGSGAMGALLSTAIALRARTVATDLDLKSNAVDSAVRIMIGVISAAVLYLVLDSNLLDEVKVQGVTLKPDINWKVALLVGFAAGFMERLVPDLLEKKLAPAMAK